MDRSPDQLWVSDHALLRFLERTGAMEVETLRAALAASLDRAHRAARSVSDADYVIKVDGLVYVVRGDAVTTVSIDTSPAAAARALGVTHRS